MRFRFPHWRNSEDEHRLIRFGMENGSPEAPVPEEDQGPEKEKRTEESREEEAIDPEKVEQEVQHAIDEADSEVKTDWKNLADRYEKAVNSVKAVAEDFPDDTEHQELVKNMEKTLAMLRDRAAGEQPQGEAQTDSKPEQNKEQTPEEQAYAKLAERLGVKPEQLQKMKASVDKLSPEDITFIENLRTEYGKQPEDKREEWLAGKLKDAPENVRNIMTEIQALQKPTEGAGDKKKEKGSEFKDFAKKFGELIEMIRDLLAECGLIERSAKKEKAESKTDKAADDALTQEVDKFLEKPGDPKKARTKLEDFGKQTDKHLSDANTDLKESKGKQTQIATELKTAQDEKAELEKNPQKSDIVTARLTELTQSIQTLEASRTEVEKAIKVHDARISALTQLKTKITAAIAALPEEKKTEEKPEAKQAEGVDLRALGIEWANFDIQKNDELYHFIEDTLHKAGEEGGNPVVAQQRLTALSIAYKSLAQSSAEQSKNETDGDAKNKLVALSLIYSAYADQTAEAIGKIPAAPAEKKSPDKVKPEEETPPADDKPEGSPGETKPEGGEKPSESAPPSAWKVKGDTEDVNAWLQEQADIHNHNNVTTLPLSETMRIAVEKSGVTIVSSEKGAVTTIQIGKVSWDVGLSNGDPIIRLSSDHNVIARIPDDAPLNANTLTRYAAKAMEYHKSETADAAGMGKGFEPSKGESMGYIELSDLTNKLTREAAQDNREFPKLLSERYNLYQTPGSVIDGSKTDPATALREQIGTLMSSGIKNIYININAHGSEDGMGFSGNRLRAAQLTALFKEFPDCKFTVNNIACFGGGLAEEMQKFTDAGGESGRVTVFTQTKEDVVNLASHTADRETTSTAYNAALARYLAQGVNGRPGRLLTYGEAHLYADQDAKQSQVTDAEVHQSRADDPTARTANIGDPTKFQGMS